MATKSDSSRVFNVLFLCTGNSARSILAEAVLARLGAPRFRAFSAGSQPKDAPHPMTLETLDRLGYDTRGLRSKSWDEFAEAQDPKMDFIVTVCDNAAAEACPIWPGRPIAAHWALPDPAAFRGTPEQTRAYFEEIHDRLTALISALVSPDSDSQSERAILARFEEISGR